jgi:hypothetical protein
MRRLVEGNLSVTYIANVHLVLALKMCGTLPSFSYRLYSVILSHSEYVAYIFMIRHKEQEIHIRPLN